MRGEKVEGGKIDNGRIGSPPRARGKAVFQPENFTGFRITPACAGKSLYDAIDLVFVQDHPRVRGEK